MHNPTEEHARQLEHLVEYMRNFPHLKLIYQIVEEAQLLIIFLICLKRILL